MSGRYDDILHLPHHVSHKRAQMSMADRAAQFSPFAALTGHDAAIRETARLTDQKIELTEDALSVLNRSYRKLIEHPEGKPTVQITYFQRDARKSGGAYISSLGAVKKIDPFQRLIYMENNAVIPMDDVLKIIFPTEI